jgi:hypothetical protein
MHVLEIVPSAKHHLKERELFIIHLLETFFAPSAEVNTQQILICTNRMKIFITHNMEIEDEIYQSITGEKTCQQTQPQSRERFFNYARCNGRKENCSSLQNSQRREKNFGPGHCNLYRTNKISRQHRHNIYALQIFCLCLFYLNRPLKKCHQINSQKT